MKNQTFALMTTSILAAASPALAQPPAPSLHGIALASAQTPMPAGTQPPSSGAQPAATGAPLSLKDAQDLALKNHPKILASQNDAAAVGEVVHEFRSAYYPTVNGALTAAQGNDNARMGAGGGLSASRLFDRVGTGFVLSQLVTDLGRTSNLVASSKLDAQASQQTYEATREDVLLAVNNAYYGALRAQAVVRVARETVEARRQLSDQVTTLAQNGLRSQLDVSFADVNLADARLLLIRSQNDLQEAYAQLARALGTDRVATYQLSDEALPPSPPQDAETLVTQAMTTRPDLVSLRFKRDAARRFTDAERDLARPSVSIVAAAGLLPYANLPGSPLADKYEGVALNVDVPLLNGGLFSARRAAAGYRSIEADNILRDYEAGVARDVRVAWANATTAFQRLDVTAQFLRSAALALDLAQGRYNLGLSSIVELTQAQLNVTRAEIEDLTAKYDYQNDSAALRYAIGQLQ
jgi:outer membrane protein